MEIHKTINIKIGIVSNRKMTWEDAKAYAAEQGMRLPTRLEAVAIMGEDNIPWCFWMDIEGTPADGQIGDAAYEWGHYDGDLIYDDLHGEGTYVVPVVAIED